MPLPKPPHGSPCNSCGRCCRAELCPLAIRMYGRRRGPCPALERDGEREVCGLIRNPGNYAVSLTMIHGRAKMSAAAMVLIGVDTKCDAVAPGETPNLAYRTEMIRTMAPKAKVDAALRTWGVGR